MLRMAVDLPPIHLAQAPGPAGIPSLPAGPFSLERYPLIHSMFALPLLSTRKLKGRDPREESEPVPGFPYSQENVRLHARNHMQERKRWPR
jgi:hypothetical protein